MYEDLRLKVSEAHDIHQKQKDNRKEISKFKVEATNTKLSKLMYDYEHYFDRGYFVDKSPEKLKEEILKEIDKINNPEPEK